MTGELVGVTVELAVGQHLVVTHHGELIWNPASLHFEQLMQRHCHDPDF